MACRTWVVWLLVAAGCQSSRGGPEARDPVVRFTTQKLDIGWDEMPTAMEERRRLARAEAEAAARLRAAGEDLRAAAHLRRAVDLHPGNVSLRLELATAFERLGDAEAALRILGETLRIAPSGKDSEHIRRHIAELERAIEKAQKAIEPSPAPSRTPSAVPPAPVSAADAILAGNELMERGAYRQAAQAYERAATDPEGRRLWGQALYQAGDYRAAVRAWEPLARAGKLRRGDRQLYEDARRRTR